MLQVYLIYRSIWFHIDHHEFAFLYMMRLKMILRYWKVIEYALPSSDLRHEFESGGTIIRIGEGSEEIPKARWLEFQHYKSLTSKKS